MQYRYVIWFILLVFLLYLSYFLLTSKNEDTIGFTRLFSMGIHIKIIQKIIEHPRLLAVCLVSIHEENYIYIFLPSSTQCRAGIVVGLQIIKSAQDKAIMRGKGSLFLFLQN